MHEAEHPQQARPHSAPDNLHYALLFASERQRSAARAFDAFCREINLVARSVREPHVASAKLAWWQTEVDNAYAGHPSHPVMRTLLPHLHAHQIEERLLLAIIEGADVAASHDCYATWPDLERYCHLSGSTIAEAQARIFGQTARQSADYARKLGLALRLTDLIQGTGRDAREGRIHMPVDEMQRFGVDMEEILDGVWSDRFAALMAFQAERAHRFFAEAFELLPEADRGTQKPGLTLASIQLRLLRALAAARFAVLDRQIDLLPLRKFWLAWKMQALGRL